MIEVNTSLSGELPEMQGIVIRKGNRQSRDEWRELTKCGGRRNGEKIFQFVLQQMDEVIDFR